MIKSIIYSLLLLSSFGLNARGLMFFTYPDSLDEGADAVVVYDHMVYERSSLTHLIEKRSLAITILKEDGESFASTYIGYDDLSKINAFECEIYSCIGQKVKSFKKKDVIDFSHYSDFTFFSDSRVKLVNPSHTSYPFTVVFSYEKEYDGFYMLNSWSPVSGYKLAVYESSLTVQTDEDLPFMFKAGHDELLQEQKNEDEGTLLYSYTLSNFKALKKESYSPSFSDQVPKVLLAPHDFVYDGHKGSNATWESAGAFSYSLFYDEDELTDVTKSDLDKLKAEASSQRDLVKKVYQYMQAKTRYVGVQIGIGGWQPMASLDVDETGYGDCKGLSYYTKAMLAYLDVESVFIVIGSGSTCIQYDDFTTNQANHAILCVPMAEDTIWLECTSQTAPFNYLSSSCTNRQVLLVKEQGGELCYVPQSHINSRDRKVAMQYKKDKLSCDEITTYSGCFFDRYSSLNRMSERELVKYLQKTSTVSDASLLSCSISLDEDSVLVHVYKSYTTSSGTTIAGDRLILDLNTSDCLSKIRKQRTSRRTQLSLGDKHVSTDSLSFILPEGYEIEFVPPSYSQESDFYSFNLDIVKGEGIITVVRQLTCFGGEFPKERYEEFIADRNKIAEVDRCQAILKKI